MGGTEEEIRAELRAMREENVKLERRLERLEATEALKPSQVKSDNPSPAVFEPAPKPEVKKTPALTVVKLKPKRERPAKINTNIEVVEPGREVWDGLGSQPEDDRDPAVADAQYDQAMASLKTGDLSGAVNKLQRFASENPKDAKADNALYYSGVGLMGMSEYEAAASVFQKLIEKYPAGDAVQDGMLKLGECTIRLNRKHDAQDIYKKVVLNFPGTEAASQAEKRLIALSR